MGEREREREVCAFHAAVCVVRWLRLPEWLGAPTSPASEFGLCRVPRMPNADASDWMSDSCCTMERTPQMQSLEMPRKRCTLDDTV